MARRRSLASSIAQMQREAARADAARVRAHAAAQREAERARAAYERTNKAEERERKRLYAESRAADVAAMNEDLETRVTDLQTLLAATLDVDDRIDFATLKIKPALPVWQPGELATPQPAPTLEEFLPPPPSGLGKLFGKAKYEQAVAAATVAHREATTKPGFTAYRPDQR